MEDEKVSFLEDGMVSFTVNKKLSRSKGLAAWRTG